MNEQLRLLVFLLFFGGRLLGQGKMLASCNGGIRFCRQTGANSADARAAFSCFFGPGLVHEPPQGPVLSSPLHQVSRPFRRSAGTDLVHKSQQSLVLSSPLHQVSGPFQRSAGALKAEKENGRGHSPFPLSLNRVE